MKKRSYTDTELINAVKVSKSYSNVLKILGLKKAGGTQVNIRKHIVLLKCDISHFTGMLWSKGKTLLDDERLSSRKKNEIFIENSKFAKSYIRNLIKKQNLIEWKCQLCSNDGNWNDKKLNLQLDHINGISTDQRLENLRFLCPNCHSQTDTFCAKNIKFTGIKKINDDELIDMYHKCKGNISQTLKNLGIANGGNYSRVYKLIESKILNV